MSFYVSTATFFFAPLWRMGPRCSSAETQVCHRSYIIAARVHIARSLVSWERGANPPFHIGPLRGPIFLGPVEFWRGQLFKNFTGPMGQIIFFLMSTPAIAIYFFICTFYMCSNYNYQILSGKTSRIIKFSKTVSSYTVFEVD